MNENFLRYKNEIENKSQKYVGVKFKYLLWVSQYL